MQACRTDCHCQLIRQWLNQVQTNYRAGQRPSHDKLTSRSSMEQPIPFPEALEAFKTFLRSQGYSDEVRWIWRDTIISSRGSGTHSSANRPIYLDLSRLGKQADIKANYDAAIARGFGLALSVFCVADGLPYCYVDIPEDAIDAEQRMMTSFRCVIPDPTPTGRPIRSPFLASVLRLFI